MAMHELKRTHYEDAGDTAIRHDTRDHRQDMTHYHVPVMQMHQAALHGWGVAVGLQVRQTGPSAVTVEEGLAIDVQGRMLALAAQGHRPGQPGQVFVHTTSPENLVNVPVAVGLEGLADGAYYLTIALATTFISPGEPVEGRWLPQEQRIVSTPLLTLQPTAGFAPDGLAVILATVTLAGGVVTQLSGAERQLVTLAVGTLVVRRGGEADGDPESGRISPLAAGGLALEVPEAGDQVVVQRAGAQSFQALTVRAQSLRIVDGTEREILHVDAAQATLRLGGEGAAGQLLVQNAAGAEVLRVNTANGDLRIGGDLDVEGIIRGNLAGRLVGGQGRPLVSLREVMNSLLRGELPGSPEASIAEAFMIGVGRGTFFDAANRLITTWRRSGQFGPWQIFAASLSPATPEEGFGPAQQITGPSGSFHHATLLDTGEVLIVYETEGAAPNIVMKRGMLDTLNPSSPTLTVTDTAASERFPFAVAVGGQVLIFWHEDAGNTWQFKRYNVANGSFSEAHRVSDIATTAEGELHAAVDSTNTLWVAFTTHDVSQHGSQIQVIAVPPGGLPGQPEPLTAPFDHNRNPFVMVDSRDNVWVFWYETSRDETSSTGSIWYRRFLRATMAWETVRGTEIPGTSAAAVHASLNAVSDAEGGIWLFWVRSTPSAANIWYAPHSPVTQTWGEGRQLTRHPGTEAEPFVLRGPDGSFRLFWDRSDRTLDFGISQLFYREIFPSI